MKYLAEPKHGEGFDARSTMYPTTLDVYTDEGEYNNVGDLYGTTYGVVVRGDVELTKITADGREKHTLFEGSYFSFPCSFSMKVGHGHHADGFKPCVVLITRLGFLGQMVTGRLEARGRLSYIDGCNDSLLVYPPRMGDPVLNHLHFPGDILQTQHTHPSIRMGVVLAGEGVSWRGRGGEKSDLRPFMELAQDMGLISVVALREAFERMDHDVPIETITTEDLQHSITNFGNGGWPAFENIDMLHHLKPGGVFQLEEGELHSFATLPGSTMEIIAYHPDSDWGPTDQDHPMLNRTYLKHGT